jgi:hypothetical protein
MADAQYVIDVAASFSGEQTIAQMDKLTSQLANAGVDAVTFQDAVVQVSSALDRAQASAAAANEALAQGAAQYRQLEKAASVAAKAQDRQAAMGVVRPEVAAAALAANQALEAHALELRKLEQAAAGAKANEDKLGLSLTNIRKLSAETAKTQATAAAQAKQDAADKKKAQDDAERAARAGEQGFDRRLKKFRSGMAGVGGPVGALGATVASSVDDFKDLEESIGTSGAQLAVFASTAAIAVTAVAAVTLAVIAATVAIAAWAIGLSDSNRNMKLQQEAAEAMHPELLALRDTIASLTRETGAHADELSQYAVQLKDAKVKAEDLPAALRAVALAEAALGQGGANDLINDFKAGKVAVGELARETQNKLGGIVAKQMMGLGAQSQRLKDNIAGTFGNLNIDPVLTGFSKIVALFDQTTASGQAMQLLFDSVFQPLINQVDKAATVVEAFVLGFLIGMVKLYIAVKPAIKAISEFFGWSSPNLTDTLSAAKKAGEYVAPVFVVLAGVFGAFAVAVTAVVAVMGGIAAAFVAPLAAVVALGVAIAAFVVYAGAQIGAFVARFDLLTPIQNAWTAVRNFFAGISLADVGTAIVMGLVGGITGAGPLVVQALTGIATSAINAVKGTLGIHSPSRVMMGLGDNTVEGFTRSVEAGTPDAQAAMADLAEPPAQTSQPTSAKGSTKAQGPSVSASFAGAIFNFYGIKDAEQAAELFEEAVTRILEGDAASLGAT